MSCCLFEDSAAVVDVVVSLTHLRHHCRHSGSFMPDVAEVTKFQSEMAGTRRSMCGFSQSVVNVDMHKSTCTTARLAASLIQTLTNVFVKSTLGCVANAH